MIPKIFAMYLPQYHQIPENNEFWGEGFTDWVTVKNAKPVFPGHNQPRVPLDGNYYDLSLADNIKWQAKLAQSYGIYGFGVYHYWFNNDKNLLTRPAEIIRDTENPGVKYFFVWDNCLWKRSWSNVGGGNEWAPIADQTIDKKKSPQILIPYILGEKPDWENHYRYVRSHFLSPNYEKSGNKPIFCINHYSHKIDEMCECWNELAKADGFNGIFFIIKHKPYQGIPKCSYVYNYEPHKAAWGAVIPRVVARILREAHIKLKPKVLYYDYDKAWKNLLSFAKKHESKYLFHGAFVRYDDSPRRGVMNSRIVKGATSDKFAKYLSELIEISKRQKKEYIFLTAWNEWGEGAYLEPDTTDGYLYLEAVRKAIELNLNN